MFGHGAENWERTSLFCSKGAVVAGAIDLIASGYVCEFNRYVTVSHGSTDPPFCLAHI